MNSREQSSPPPEGALVVGVDGSDRDPLVLDAAIDAAPALAEMLDDHVVGKAVGNTRNDSPALIEPVE